MSDDVLDYSTMVQEALRLVPRLALREVARYGLPEPHHLYLSFRTDYPGVGVPSQLRERYPEEMTVVLQHQFHDLEVDAEGFSVTLYFGGRPAQISVPFEALTAFVDPGVGFGLRFDGGEEAEAEQAAEAELSKDTAPPGEDGAGDGAGKSAEVISIDKFRKK